MGKIQKSRPKLQQNQEQDSKYNPIQSNHDLRIKLEHELYQKVRQAVHTPPRERIIRRRLNEFQYEIQKRLKIEEEKKKLAIQMNDLINLGITNTTESFISSLNNITKINCIDLRMHPESYYQNLKCNYDDDDQTSFFNEMDIMNEDTTDTNPSSLYHLNNSLTKNYLPNHHHKSIKNNNNNLLTRQMIMEKFGRLTDNEKQLFYFSATRAAYLIASIQSQHKLPDGTQFRLINQSNKKPLDYVKINNLFINQTINDPSNKINNHNNTNQTSNGSLYTLPTLIDWNSVVRDRHGPFWPHNYGPICQTLYNLYIETNNSKDDYNVNKPIIPDYTEEIMQLRNKQPYFKGIRVIFDSECSPCLSGDSSTSTSPSLDIKQFVEELTNVQQWTPPCLVFESRFESGNLRQVRRIGPFHYELLLKPDLYTKRHVQWYFFRIQNILPGFIYTFLIINFTKSTSLYSQGLQPLLYSKINYQQNGKKWIRVGRNIKYTRNTMNLSNHLLDTNGEYYQLEWEMEFPYSNDICYLAYSYPYTYTNLKFDINELLMKSKENDLLNKTINCDVLCQTRAGNSCFLITITDQSQCMTWCHANQFQRRTWYVYTAYVVCPRDRPFCCHTRLQLEVQLFPRILRRNKKKVEKPIIIYIINCSNCEKHYVRQSGRPLHLRPHEHQLAVKCSGCGPLRKSPVSVWVPGQYHNPHTNQLRFDVIYCDIHGHSRRNNIFMYGCDPLYRHSKIFNHTKQTLHERILPYILSQQATSYFSFPNCRFTIHPSKEATSRVVFWREFEVINSFTLEATFNGSTLQNNNLIKFEVDDFLKMGELLGDSLYRFHEVLSNPLLNRRLYYLSKYAGQSNNGIPCFVEKRLFHRSCQLETKMSNLRRTDNLTNIDVLKYLKQIHLIAKRQLQLIQSQFIPITDKNHPYKPTTIHETVPNGIGIPYPPPLPVFTTTGRQIKTHSATITTNGDAVKRNISIIGDIERKSNHLIPRSRSCNLFLRNNHNNYRNQNNNKLLELPKIVEKLSENNMIHHSRNNYNILNGIDMKV
ncbi:Mername-AA213 putative peptidase (M14 family) [Schistosoma mansoni]|uniref:Mername-AA213 putative peptidase (M14 family) n=1 Tax=Schistosoma mansoni TaxID=6183 RepID=UPI00022C81C7|nr:Mername-AA213 putative peptidase (M14 family) [Schistosoma mansoni]|eukprot:XP_018647138.1 Mername-AA213 putative peptidase (M14 family) [Schistosoma mansoni]